MFGLRRAWSVLRESSGGGRRLAMLVAFCWLTGIALLMLADAFMAMEPGR